MHPAKLVSIVMLVSLTLGAGLQVNRAHLAAIFKDLSLLGRAFLANFIVVPIFGVLLARGFRLAPDVATGFLLMAISPGVPFVMASVRKKGGSLGLAVLLALLFPLFSVFTVPVTASLVLPGGEQAQLPLLQFVITLLLFQLLPLIAGMVLAERLPAVASKIERPLQLLFLLSIVVLVVLLGSRLARDVGSVYGSNGMWAMLCISVLAMITGWLLGAPNATDRRTLSIGTALRNIGLCAVIATTTFGHEPRVAAAVLAYLLIQFVVTMIVGVYFTRTARRAMA